jgi:hypothetical protein
MVGSKRLLTCAFTQRQINRGLRAHSPDVRNLHVSDPMSELRKRPLPARPVLNRMSASVHLVRKRTDRNPEEFWAPAGVRKPWMNEPAGFRHWTSADAGNGLADAVARLAIAWLWH